MQRFTGTAGFIYIRNGVKFCLFAFWIIINIIAVFILFLIFLEAIARGGELRRKGKYNGKVGRYQA